MGRKTRNKIKKYRNTAEPESDSDVPDDPEQLSQEMLNRYHDCLCETRRKMIEYCDKNSLPLCDYLTYDTMEYFINFMKE